MLEKERETLKANAEQLANLLTENVPYLLGHYLQNGVLTESEREDIIQADSAQEIRTKLVKTLAAKEGISLKAVIEGLNATENHCVSEEINNLLSEVKTGEEVSDNGSGDQPQDLSTFANNLVDEVIAKAERATASEAEEELEKDGERTVRAQEQVDENTKEPTFRGEPSTTEVADVEELPTTEEIPDKLVETSVEVHTTEADVPGEQENNENDVGVDDESVKENDTTQESIADVDDESLESIDEASSDVPDRSVNFSDNISTVIEDGKHNNQFEVSSSPTSPTTPSTEESQSHELDTEQNESENEDVDNIDIEKEFVMPPEAQTNLNNNSISNTNVTNGGAKLVRMESNDIVLDDGNKDGESKNNEANDNELAAVLARKALVRQQVELFEKNSPGPGKIKYSIRTANQDKEPEIKSADGSESKVKNLKNFFQRLSTSDNKTSSPSSGPAKSVGKLKVTFPASS